MPIGVELEQAHVFRDEEPVAQTVLIKGLRVCAAVEILGMHCMTDVEACHVSQGRVDCVVLAVSPLTFVLGYSALKMQVQYNEAALWLRFRADVLKPELALNCPSRAFAPSHVFELERQDSKWLEALPVVRTSHEGLPS